MKNVDLYEVRLDDLSDIELSDLLTNWLQGGEAHTIVTPNPEIILRARKKSAFRDLLNQSDLSLPDGTGLRFASVALHNVDIRRHTGVDTLELLAKLSAENKQTMFLFGGELPHVAEQTADVLNARYPNAKVDGIDPGMISIDAEGKLQFDKQLIEHLQLISPTVLAVALGQEKQDRFIAEVLPKLPSVRIAIGVGGAFDMLSGAIPRSPKWMQKSGLEWIWRLIKEPSRAKRIYRAFVVFPCVVAWDTLRKRQFLSACRRVFPVILKQLTGK